MRTTSLALSSLFALAVLTPSLASAEGTDADVAAIESWKRENAAFAAQVGGATFAGWWKSVNTSLFGRNNRPIARDFKVLRNVLIQLREHHADRFTPRQQNAINRKIANFDQHAAGASDRHETGIPRGFIDKLPEYPGTKAAWRVVPPPRRGIAGVAHRAWRAAARPVAAAVRKARSARAARGR